MKAPNWKNIVFAVLVIFITGSGVFSIAGFFGKYGLVYDLACNFRVQYAAVQLFCLAGFLILKSRKWFVASALFALMNICLIMPFYMPAHRVAHKKRGMGFSVLIVNVHTSNRDYERTIRIVKQMRPDILAIEEVDSQWVAAISALNGIYPYRKTLPRDDNFGIALLSRIPLESAREEYYTMAGVPSIAAKINIGGRPVTVLVTHPVPPTDGNYFSERNEQLKRIAESRKDYEENLVVAGDLNTTNWSYFYKRFESDMKLRSSRPGFGVMPSWPTTPWYMRIPLDHFLTSENIVTREMRLGPDVGSDHFPVYVELWLNY